VRDTWLKGLKDIDLFIVLDRSYGRKILPKVLEAMKDYVGEGWVEAYAEHPYIQAWIDGFKVELVPCFRTSIGEKLLSATDRTPLHTEYLGEHLEPEMKDEVMLLKQFTKGLGVYGAEIKVGGFSGYLCELLILNYGTFDELIDRATGWRRKETITFTEEPPKKKFRDPLIVVDPVDPKRNVASALTGESFWTFVAAARAFKENPDKRFFYPKPGRMNRNELLEAMESSGMDHLFLVIDDGEVDIPDSLWGQLQKTEAALSQLLEERSFPLVRSGTWSDEAMRHILVFQIASTSIPSTALHLGPPVDLEEDGERFIQAHLGAESTVSGPGIRGSKWWVVTKREFDDALKLLIASLRFGGRDLGVSRKIAEKIKASSRVLLNYEISPYLEDGFEEYLEQFLKGRPGWLE
jgi:tRNA nucleotidyltransferase (CCA-adding enzyme)